MKLSFKTCEVRAVELRFAPRANEVRDGGYQHRYRHTRSGSTVTHTPGLRGPLARQHTYVHHDLLAVGGCRRGVPGGRHMVVIWPPYRGYASGSTGGGGVAGRCDTALHRVVVQRCGSCGNAGTLRLRILHRTAAVVSVGQHLRRSLRMKVLPDAWMVPVPSASGSACENAAAKNCIQVRLLPCTLHNSGRPQRVSRSRRRGLQSWWVITLEVTRGGATGVGAHASTYVQCVHMHGTSM